MEYITSLNLSLLSPFGSLRFERMGDGHYRYVSRSADESAFIESLSLYKNGDIFRREVVSSAPLSVEDVEYVTNAKQALEWLVKNKGEKRGVLSKEQIRALAEKHGVSFPNWK